jgi:hypothetical protein
MKKIYYLSILITSFFSAQQSEVISTPWYLSKIVSNNTDYPVPQNSEISTVSLTFTSPGQYTGFQTGFCGGTFGGLIDSFYTTPYRFSIWSSYGDPANVSCTIPYNISLYNRYANFFRNSATEINYEIQTSGGTKNLILTNSNGEKAYYFSALLNSQSITLNDTSISIFPNSVKEDFIEIRNIKQIGWVKIFNSEGKLLLSQNNSDSRINVSNLPVGIYYIELQSQKGISRHKFLRE